VGSYYVARYRLTRWTRAVLPISWLFGLGFPVGGVVMALDPEVSFSGDILGVDSFVAFVVIWSLICLLFLYVAVSWTVAIGGKRAALRLDADGVTLRPVPPFVAGRPVTIPWDDLEAVILYTKYVRNIGRQPFLGLRLRPDARRLFGLPRVGSVWAWLRGRPADASILIRGWRLNELELSRSINSYDPRVRIERIVES